jgi:predicted anti-sigma-YlaC factor YlaD
MVSSKKNYRSCSNVLTGLLLMAAVLCCCSPRKLATNSIANALSTEGSLVFIGEDDPELVGDALPFALKLYESLLEKAPDNLPLAVATGKAFALYAFAFVQSPAERLGNADLEKKKEELLRAKRLFLRGRDYLLAGLDGKYPGFGKQIKSGSTDSALSRVSMSDTTALYWAGVSWVGAIMADKFDFGMLLGLKRAVSLIDKVASFNDEYGQGAVHEFYISYFGSLPGSMGGSEQKARDHFARAVELSQGKTASPYVSLATSISVKNQNVDEFRDLLGKALAVDVSERSANRLANIISRRKAQWLLDHIDDYFLSAEPQLDTTITDTTAADTTISE